LVLNVDLQLTNCLRPFSFPVYPARNRPLPFTPHLQGKCWGNLVRGFTIFSAKNLSALKGLFCLLKIGQPFGLWTKGLA